MKPKKKKSTALGVAKNLQRKLAIQQGFYDGRFNQKVVKDKKKEESKRKGRRKVNSKDWEE
jgi:hypothetical protein